MTSYQVTRVNCVKCGDEFGTRKVQDKGFWKVQSWQCPGCRRTASQLLDESLERAAEALRRLKELKR